MAIIFFIWSQIYGKPLSLQTQPGSTALPSLNTARMEAVAEGAAQAEREPGEGRSEDRGREAPRTSFRDRRFAPAIDPGVKKRA